MRWHRYRGTKVQWAGCGYYKTQRKKKIEGNSKGICEELKVVEGGLERRSTVKFHKEELSQVHTGPEDKVKGFIFTLTNSSFVLAATKANGEQNNSESNHSQEREGGGETGC